MLIRFLDCFDEQKIYLAPWRVLVYDESDGADAPPRQAHATKRQQEQRGKPNRKARRSGAVPAKPLGIGCRFSAVQSFLLIGFAVPFTS